MIKNIKINLKLILNINNLSHKIKLTKNYSENLKYRMKFL